MNDEHMDLYSHAQRYDLVMGGFASGDQLDCYRRYPVGQYKAES